MPRSTMKSTYDNSNALIIQWGAVAMNRAPVDPIDHPMTDAIHAALLQADANEEVRAIV